MKATVLYGPRDIRFEDRPDPTIIKPTDAILRLSATCICGSDLWPYRGIANFAELPTPMGHEYCGIVEEVGKEVRNIKPGQFVVGSFVTSDNTCVICHDGYQSSCVQREFMLRRTSSALARVACGRDVGTHARCSSQRTDTQSAGDFRCVGHGLVCRGCSQCKARENSRGGR